MNGAGPLLMGFVVVTLATSGCTGEPDTRSTPSPRSPTAPTPPSPSGSFRLEPVVEDLDEPVYVAAVPGQPDRLYVVERAGRILVVDGGELLEQPFLDVRGEVRTQIEEGMHSLAFHPRFETNRLLYVDYNDRRGDIHVTEFQATADGTGVEPGARRDVLLIDKPRGVQWHNGGQLQFGPDGHLYVGVGDAGRNPLDPLPDPHPPTSDPDNHAQDPSVPFGKLLRIDVDRAKPEPTIVAYGLRNPWRFSFDRDTGDLYIGDVGWQSYEEIDYLAAGWQSPVNFGWSVYEGEAEYNADFRLIRRGRLVEPLVVYSHGGPGYCSGRASVIGGYVYRGTAVPALQGRYLYGDFCSGEIFSLRVEGGEAADDRTEPERVTGLVSFGEDAAGELYVVSLSEGTVLRLSG